MDDCLFCKIASGQQKSETLYEDNDVKVFKDIFPKAPIHLLVIPKIHIQSIAYLEHNHSSVLSKLIYTAKDVASQQGLKGYKLVFNVGKEGGQIIDHLHLHILGGWGHGERDDGVDK